MQALETPKGPVLKLGGVLSAAKGLESSAILALRERAERPATISK